ncbi:MAG: hypothetical protein M3353_04540 [Actinomycetota bacterium]|nr:hypothetical protein [Actinomycetota bacterium]
MRPRFVAAYGAHPLHLLAMLASFALAGYAAVRLVETAPVAVGVWFVATAVGHDLLLLPLYAIVDTGLVRVWRRRRTGDMALPRVRWINYVRVPAMLAGLLLLVFLPSIFRLGEDDYTAATGLLPDQYLANWLLVSAVLFGVSAVAYAVRLRRSTKG